MKKGLLIGLGIIILSGGWLVSTRNGLVTADENVKASWAQVENIMQRRADLIPNLVETVKGYAKQEKEIFIQIAEARSRLAGAKSVPEKIQANQQIEGALARLLVVVERYPDLKSNQNFMSLQDELAGTENRLSVERKRYNETVQIFNVRIRRFPANLVAGFFGFSPKDAYFEVAEAAKQVPQVKF